MVTLTIQVDDADFASIMADAMEKKAIGTLAGAGMMVPPPTVAPIDPWAEPRADFPTPPSRADFPTPPSAGAPPQNPVPPAQFSPPGTPSASPPSGAGYAPPQYQPPPSSAPAAGTPACDHGPMKYVQGGFSKNTGKPYPAFWACQGPRGSGCRGRNA